MKIGENCDVNDCKIGEFYKFKNNNAYNHVLNDGDILLCIKSINFMTTKSIDEFHNSFEFMFASGIFTRVRKPNFIYNPEVIKYINTND